MQYIDLYNFSEDHIAARRTAGQKTLVVVASLTAQISRNVSWLDRVRFYPISCQQNDPIGHYECIAGQDVAYEAENAWMAYITYDDTLNVCWQRFVWCKELMHVFDTDDGLVRSRDQYTGFIEEIEMEPLDPTEQYMSENRAKWMALLVLCPRSEREYIMSHCNEMTDYEVALRYRIPKTFVRTIRSIHYINAYNDLIQSE